MKAAVDRALRTAHNWAGLAVSLVLVAIALSGSLLVWKSEWLELTQPGARSPVVVDARAFGRDAEAAERVFGAEALGSITFAGPGFGLHQAYLRDGGGAYLEPGTGRFVARWSENERFIDWLFDLHHHLLLGETGTTVAGWVGFAGLLLTLTGLYLWWPARNLWSLRAAPRSGARAHWVAVHRDLGVVTAPVALFILFSGWAMAVPEASKPALGVRSSAPVLTAGDGEMNWSAALLTAQARFPGAAPRMAVWPKPGGPAVVRLRQPGEWHANGRSQVLLDPADGAVLAVIDAQAEAASGRLYNTLWPVHAVKVGGLPWKLVVCLAGLGLAAVSLYGAESFRRRLFTRPVRRRPTSLPAAAPAE